MSIYRLTQQDLSNILHQEIKSSILFYKICVLNGAITRVVRDNGQENVVKTDGSCTLFGKQFSQKKLLAILEFLKPIVCSEELFQESAPQPVPQPIPQQLNPISSLQQDSIKQQSSLIEFDTDQKPDSPEESSEHVVPITSQTYMVKSDEGERFCLVNIDQGKVVSAFRLEPIDPSGNGRWPLFDKCLTKSQVLGMCLESEMVFTEKSKKQNEKEINLLDF